MGSVHGGRQSKTGGKGNAPCRQAPVGRKKFMWGDDRRRENW